MRSSNSINWYTALCFLGIGLLSLSGCSGGKGDDLDEFMATAAKDVQPRTEPIPEVKPYTPFQYNADGQLHDPFKARKAQSSKGIQPNMNRPREPLEAYPLESLKYVGTLSKANMKYALIKTPDENIQQVKIGNYVGQNFGIVSDINDTEVVLKEIVQDQLSGDWAERTTSMALQE